MPSTRLICAATLLAALGLAACGESEPSREAVAPLETVVMIELEQDEPDTLVLAAEPITAGPGSYTSSIGSEPIVPGVLAAVESAEEFDEIRRSAIARLTLTGRSVESAECVVEHLLEVGALDALTAEQFGMGLDPLEADALATCS